MHIFKINKIKNNSIYLHNDDIHHIVKVLHKKVGDVIFCTNNNLIYETKISNINPLILEIVSWKENEINPYNINCFLGLIDKKSFEEALININQLNCKTITPVLFSRSQSNIKYDYERLNKIIVESNKQCGRINGIILNNIISFDDMLNMINGDNWVLAYENENNSSKLEKSNEFNVIVGPEGGITICEYEKLIKKGVRPMLLTNTILKAEIAMTYICSVLIDKIK